MIQSALPVLSGWENFYVIIGSSAAALTGLQFVVMALVADRSKQGNPDQVDAFGTPTIVHFCLALLMSGALSAPWKTLTSPAVTLGLIGLGGLTYAAIVIRRTRMQQGYKPVFEDWLWHTILPTVSYGVLLGAAIALPVHTLDALFFVAVSAMLLVFIGIHNAWDTVIFIATGGLERQLVESPAAKTDPERAPDARPEAGR